MTDEDATKGLVQPLEEHAIEHEAESQTIENLGELDNADHCININKLTRELVHEVAWDEGSATIMTLGMETPIMLPNDVCDPLLPRCIAQPAAAAASSQPAAPISGR